MALVGELSGMRVSNDTCPHCGLALELGQVLAQAVNLDGETWWFHYACIAALPAASAEELKGVDTTKMEAAGAVLAQHLKRKLN